MGLGVASVVYAPCGSRPAQGDWLAVMRRNADVLGGLADRAEKQEHESVERDPSRP